MTRLKKELRLTSGLLAMTLIIAMSGQTFASSRSKSDENPPAVQNAVYNGVSCDHVRAKVAESGVTAAYAYARYMGLTSRDIARVRKACSV